MATARKKFIMSKEQENKATVGRWFTEFWGRPWNPDIVDELGTRKEVEYAYRILSEGSSADRQLATFAKTNDLKAVVDQLIIETAEGVMDLADAESLPPVAGIT